MEKKTLPTLFASWLFQIPDYQRGYAWEDKQWGDFVQDVDALVDKEVQNHYTGTVVVYQSKDKPLRNYGATDRLELVDVVDGQQRLTTCCLYLSAILRALVQKGASDYALKIPQFLYSGPTCKVTLNNDTSHFFYDLLRNGRPNTPANSTHEKRLENAYRFLQSHLDKQLAAKGKDGLQYLQDLYDAITRKLVFTFYTIEEECEIGMTFELMNSRGKDLSVLELLKNYLMHWVSRNGVDEAERSAMTVLINKDWKDTYTNLGVCGGNEDQCLRVAWTLYCSHTPKNWAGYQGFKQDAYIPLRNFGPKTRTKEDTKAFIPRFADGLAEVSRHYATIISPTAANTLSGDELKWLTKIHHTGNIANFLPLIVAARIRCEEGGIEKSDYRDLLMALECFAYRVFLFEGKRSNAGMSSFYGWANDVFTLKCGLGGVTNKIHALVRYYASEDSFVAKCAEPSNWYTRRRLLRYTLFEYELELLDTEGKGKAPLLAWEQLNDSTFEHILPQNPQEGSHWRAVWNADDTNRYLHDIGNLVLTQNNSNYLMFDFDRKKGSPGVGPSYSNSDIRQERKIAAYADWTPTELRDRRDKLVPWITKRWKTLDTQAALVEEIDDEDDMDVSPGSPVSEPSQ